MSSKSLITFIISLLILVGALGCSDESAMLPASEDPSTSGIARGEVDPEKGDFQIEIEPAQSVLGPFALHGSNVHYDEALGAVVVDLKVINIGRTTHPEPIGLTFVDLLPPGVTVLNPDNGTNGPGAMIHFEFANDDAMWTPGEESFPRVVQFGVESAMSVGFVARLDVGDPPRGGSIGGIVWHDHNEDGMMDPDEPGLGGVEILLYKGDLADTNSEELRRTVSAEDGSYRFDGLGPGFYTVFKPRSLRYRPTTPSSLQVVLIEVADGVSDFLRANFGCVPSAERPVVRTGDYVMATGRFTRDAATTAAGGVIVAREVVVYRCGDRPCHRPGVLNGPVTEVARERRAIRVMTEWVGFADSVATDRSFADDLDPGDVNVGDRVSAIVVDRPSGVTEPLVGLSLMKWGEAFDQTAGFVKRIGGDPNSRTYLLVVLRHMQVAITPDTRVVIREID